MIRNLFSIFFVYYNGDEMKFFKNFDRYLMDLDYKITIYKNKVHVMNYLEVVDFSDTRVVIRYEGGESIFNGKNLVVSRMQDNELLIEGKIISIEV